MKCVVCGKEVPFRLASEDGGMHPWCSAPCGDKWSKRNNFLFDLKSVESRESVEGSLSSQPWSMAMATTCRPDIDFAFFPGFEGFAPGSDGT
jgi:hypothetical protein